MALLWQVYRLLVNLPNFSSGFSNFIKSLKLQLNIFAVRQFLQTILLVDKLSDTRD